MIKCFINKEELYPVYFLKMSSDESNDIPITLEKHQVDYIIQARKDFDKVQEIIAKGVDMMKQMEERKQTSQSDK